MDFFNKISNTISSTSKDVAQKAKDITEITKLSAEIRDTEKKISDAMHEIGSAYYLKYKSDEDCEFHELVTIISKNYDIISNLEKKISVVKGLPCCKNCGSVLDKDSQFCTACGSRYEPIEPEIITNVEKTFICNDCGNTLSSDTGFCPYCGKKLL
ncbi:MAG: zinc ribbon domain-containing protein [Lachnotalea sp.]